MSVCLAEKVSKVLDRFEPNSVPKDSLGPGEDIDIYYGKLRSFRGIAMKEFYEDGITG